MFLNSDAMRGVKRLIDRVAPTDATILVLGESGTGKEVVARAIHDLSPRRGRPFVKVNCAALPLELLESELFGYERGAFTGAHRAKPGKFELAHTGTILLDEIAEMPPALQAKLLHVLQDFAFSRLGGQTDLRVDVRVIAATNRDLHALTAAGRFRADLYYRLNVVAIRVPPLRERREEIPVLVDHFLREYGRRYGRPAPRLRPETTRRLMSHAWPGNVRELENIVRRIVVLGDDEWIGQALGPPAPSETPASDAPGPARGAEPGLKDLVRRAALEVERRALKEALDATRWNRIEAARRLKISYRTLLEKIRAHGLDG